MSTRVTVAEAVTWDAAEQLADRASQDAAEPVDDDELWLQRRAEEVDAAAEADQSAAEL